MSTVNSAKHFLTFKVDAAWVNDIMDQVGARAVLILVYARMWTAVIFQHNQPAVATMFQPLYKSSYIASL